PPLQIGFMELNQSEQRKGGLLKTGFGASKITWIPFSVRGRNQSGASLPARSINSSDLLSCSLAPALTVSTAHASTSRCWRKPGKKSRSPLLASAATSRDTVRQKLRHWGGSMYIGARRLRYPHPA